MTPPAVKGNNPGNQALGWLLAVLGGALTAGLAILILVIPHPNFTFITYYFGYFLPLLVLGMLSLLLGLGIISRDRGIGPKWKLPCWLMTLRTYGFTGFMLILMVLVNFAVIKACGIPAGK